jgi:SlyX protein
VTATLEQRLTELEVRLTFLDDTVSALVAAEAEQAQRVLVLEQVLRELRQELVALRVSQAPDPHSEPPPPHY